MLQRVSRPALGVRAPAPSASRPAAAPMATAAREEHSNGGAVAPRPAWDLSRVRIFPPSAINQRPLQVGAADDSRERQADRIADRVMRMPDAIRRPSVDSAPSPISTAAAAPPIVHEVLMDSGRPLDAPTRTFFESRFGHDFGAVRVHTDAKAAESAREVSALAYTVRSNIVFGAGQYEPATRAGMRLMAHELTHVIQQKAQAQTVQRQTLPKAPSANSGLGGMPSIRRMTHIMCGNSQMRDALDMIARDGIHIVCFQTGLDKWKYDDGRVEEVPIPGLLGNTDINGRKIRLNEAQSPETMAVTLYHELQHWKHAQDPKGPRGLESEIQARIATEQLAIDRGRPETGSNYRTKDGRVNEAEIRRAMAASPHYSPKGRQRIGRRYEGETEIPAALLVCPQVGDFPAPSREKAVA